MTEGHKHRTVKVKEGGAIVRLLTGHVLMRTRSRAWVERSNMVWFSEPEDLESGPYLLRPHHETVRGFRGLGAPTFVQHDQALIEALRKPE